MSNSQDTRKFDPEEWRKTLIQMREKGETELCDTIAKLEKLVESVDAVRLFLAAVANTSFGPEGSFSEITHGDIPAKIETLAYYAYPFFGKSQQEITPWHINECIEILDKILALRLMVPHFPKDDREPDPLEEIVTTVRIQAEVVRGSAFPEQTSSEIISIQGRFENWFKEATSIGPTRAQAILWSIIRAQEKGINSVMPDIRKQVQAAGKKWQEIRKKSPRSRSPAEDNLLEVLQDEQAAKAFEFVYSLNTIASEVLPIGLNDVNDLEPLPTPEEWEGLIGLIGMTKNRREAMS